MKIKYTEKELNSIDKTLLIKMLPNHRRMIRN